MPQQGRDEVSRSGSLMWVVSLLKRHYVSYVAMVLTSAIVGLGLHFLYPRYNAFATLYINSTEDSQLLSRLRQVSGYYGNPYKEKDDADKYIKLFETQSFIYFVKDKIAMEASEEGSIEKEADFLELAEELVGMVNFSKVDAETIQISGTSKDPSEVLTIVRKMAVYAREAIINFELTEIENAESYLRSEMDQSKNRLTNLSREIEKFKKNKKNLEFSLSDKQSPIKSSISRLQADLEVTQVQLSRNQILKDQLTKQIKEFSASNEGKNISGRGRSFQLLKTLEEESESLSASKMALENRLGALKGELTPGYEQRVYEFQKQIELEYSFFETLQQNLFQSGIQSISVKNKVSSVDLPRDQDVFQKLPILYKLTLAFLMATLATIVVVALVEYFFPVVIGKNHLVELGFTYLAHIPKLSLNSSILSPKRWINSTKDTVVQICADIKESEGGIAFRYLRVRFLQTLMGFQEMNKVFAVGSARPNEGKSFISVNFAISLSSVGKKVLLIDSDERVSSVSKVMSDLIGDGLVQYCKGQATLDEVIIKDAHPNLDVLPVGYHEAEESLDMLSSGKLKKVCDQLRNKYDFIFIDTPAFHAGADALLVYEIVDMPILVFESGKTSIVEAHNLYDVLRTLGHKTIFAVLNHYKEIFEIKPQSYYYAIPKRSKGDVA